MTLETELARNVIAHSQNSEPPTNESGIKGHTEIKDGQDKAEEGAPLLHDKGDTQSAVETENDACTWLEMLTVSLVWIIIITAKLIVHV